MQNSNYHSAKVHKYSVKLAQNHHSMEISLLGVCFPPYLQRWDLASKGKLVDATQRAKEVGTSTLQLAWAMDRELHSIFR